MPQVVTQVAAAAETYLSARLCVLPARRVEKRPAVGAWKQYQKRLPTKAELSAWFTDAGSYDALCIICGSVSGNTEIIDFDGGGEHYAAWWDRIPGELRDKLVVDRTPSGGYHVGYRCEVAVSGNMKLAQRHDGATLLTLIETRGEGGLFLCAPTPGYELIQGDLCNLPVLSEAERDVLLQTAWDLNEYEPPVINGPAGSANLGAMGASSAENAHMCDSSADHSHISACGPENAERPGDAFNRRGDVRDVLRQHGWVLARPGENEYWRRPGRTSGWSATLKNRVFYVFSSNAAPFEPNRAYSPFAVYTMLERGGNYEQAALSLRYLDYGSDSLAENATGVDISGIVGGVVDGASHNAESGAEVAEIADGGDGPPDSADMSESRPELIDPGPMPNEMLRIPGFISEVMDHTLAIAPYPNQALAFAGALALQAFLGGRRVRDHGDNRTNLYLLGLAHSGAGKDQSRKVNNDIIHAIGLGDCLGQSFSSGEGIQDALFQTPTMLFQTDEIDGMLQSINKAKDARHEAIMSTLLTMYSASNSVFPMRRKAGKESPGVIDQPCLVIFGTAIPNHYYAALSERMLTNGFFARMIIVEAGPRGSGQEPSIGDLPERVLETAKWWASYQPSERRGNLLAVHPAPAIVEHTDEAKRVLIETREQAEAEYTKAEGNSDSVGTTVWGRVSEQTRKLALLYAISIDYRSPRITLDAVQWASRFVMHQTRRMLIMAQAHVAENPFHAECLKAMQKLREAPGGELSHQVLLKRMKMDARSFRELIETLIQRGEVVAVQAPTAGRTRLTYRLIDAGEER